MMTTQPKSSQWVGVAEATASGQLCHLSPVEPGLAKLVSEGEVASAAILRRSMGSAAMYRGVVAFY